MAQIRVSDEAAAELKRRADEQRRSIVAVVDLLLESDSEPEPLGRVTPAGVDAYREAAS